ncbi:MAG: 4Fe-4S dicluster domain-containing protein [Gemmatimonadales bacterium]|nr:4Fe-4S dicluster domain-containing protein [Gemmatimonadales bacterium]
MSDQTTREPLDRRRFLKVVGVAGAGTAALSGCSTGQVEKLVPYLVQSEDQVPSLPTIYASTCTECAAGCGIHVRTREARAIKLEGNPDHPINAGAICARGQASLQGLYNPDRLKGPLGKNTVGKTAEILPNEAIDQLAVALGQAGNRVAVVSGAGPGTFSDLLAQWVGATGGKLVRYRAFDHEPVRLAAQRVFGVDEVPAHDFGAARMIVSFGADFLETWNSPVENQRGFAKAHGFDGREMAKFVYVGPRMSLTGINADQWLAPTPGSEVSLALGIANAVLSTRTSAPADAAALRPLLAQYGIDRVAQDTGLPAEAVRKLFDEFAAVTPSLAVAGGVALQHPAAVDLCAAVHILNYVAGNVGTTVRFGAGTPAGDGYGALAELQKAMDAGQIDLVIFHEANPLHSVPKSSGFAAALAKVKVKVSTSLYFDDTAAVCDLVIPDLHPLERWDDARPRAGVFGLMQPVMEPVYRNVSTADVLLQAARKVGGTLAATFTAPTYEAHLRTVWAELARARGAGNTEAFWRAALANGGVYDPAPAPRAVALAATAGQLGGGPATIGGDGEFIFAPFPSSMYYDGRGANRPWLLENPDPVTKITWQSWIEVHPDAARELDVREGEILKLTSAAGSIESSVYVYPGVRKDVLAMPLGLGHAEYGRYAKGRGANAADLLSADAGAGFLPYLATRVKVEKTGRYRKVAKTEGNPRELGRGITETMPVGLAARGLTVEQAYQAEGHEPHEINTEGEKEAIKGFDESQREKRKFGAYALEQPMWGMAIDLSRCTGCSSCVTACYAENNIPHVGEDDIFRGREMSWLRIERYFHGGEDGEPISARVIPMLCQHCDNAPCEPVCPVYAAYHTADGLNGQVYNRCVGTRYCANNCPYKVRYFNWYAYAKLAFPEPLNLQLNPDVTVRARGVMEKCTFCVQRIRAAQTAARLEDRPLRDGDVITACAQACPSGAITFGNMKDPESKVSVAARNHRGYHVLEDINVRPAVTYLAKVVHGSEA